MKLQEKQKIADELKDFCTEVGGQGVAERKLTGISRADIDAIIRDDWDLIDEGIWRKISKQLGMTSGKIWVDGLEASRRMFMYLNDAKRHQEVHAIAHHAGGAKSFSSRRFAATNPNVMYVQCSEYFNNRTFLSKILQSMGMDRSGTQSDMIERIVDAVMEMDEPLLILDEVDKLKDKVLYFFITLYNELENYCGIVIMATNHMEKQVKKGVTLNKLGYNEIFSRIGRKFLGLKLTPEDECEDMVKLCEGYGIKNKTTQAKIIKQSEFDYRRTVKLIRVELRKREQLKEQKTAA